MNSEERRDEPEQPRPDPGATRFDPSATYVFDPASIKLPSAEDTPPPQEPAPAAAPPPPPQPWQPAAPQPQAGEQWQQQPQHPGYQTAATRPTSGLAIAALITGVLGFVLSFFVGPFALPLPIAAIVTGVMGRKQTATGAAGGRGMATAGMWLGIAWFVVGVLLVLVLGGLIALGGGLDAFAP